MDFLVFFTISLEIYYRFSVCYANCHKASKRQLWGRVLKSGNDKKTGGSKESDVSEEAAFRGRIVTLEFVVTLTFKGH